ncbi:unnamed protein product [Caenorhabditis sp. 36 PRJEB53466]|nr:unnamed protein product [Caenorhabditis sp. 36 PRJEB53466]
MSSETHFVPISSRISSSPPPRLRLHSNAPPPPPLKMLRFSALLILLTASEVVSAADQTCEDRCKRLKQRSLSRIGYDDERLQTLLERQRPRESMKDVCWRLYDNLDCMKKCPKSEKHASFAKHVRNKCKFVLEEMEPTLKCISKHHSFLTMRCSSFLNEASRLRAESDLSTTPRHDECRFLHLTTICLENHVNTFCPDGRIIFRRLNFRDYFLSFILPMDDDLFDDEDLDSCQIYDFVKDAEKREREEAERKQEEERRRRIEDDEDYEEELTTIVNDMEEDSEVSLTSQMPTSSVSTPTAKTAELTTLLNDLITSAEHSEEETNQKEHEKGENEGDEHRKDLDTLVEKLDGNKANSEEHTEKDEQSPSELPLTDSTSTIIMPSNQEDYQDQEYSEHHYDEEYDEPEDNSTHPTISVVSIETRLSESASAESPEGSEEEQLVEVTTPDVLLNLTPPNKVGEESEEIVTVETTTTGKRKVFSEDSMENTPPNFFYSSNRYDSTTRSNYVADNLDLQDSEEPLEIDTSTLFGIERTSTEMTTSVPKRVDGKPRPWLQGGVIVKPILNFDQMDVDQDEERERENRRLLHRNLTSSTSSESSSSSPDEDDFLADSEGPSTNETLIVIGLIALVICLIFLILLLLLAYFCSARTDSYNVQKDEASPPV